MGRKAGACPKDRHRYTEKSLYWNCNRTNDADGQGWMDKENRFINYHLMSVYSHKSLFDL